jgi:large subunit ribosomal protein L29
MLEKEKLRKMKRDELTQELFKLNKELFEISIKSSTGEAIKPHHKKVIKKDIARIKTIMSQVVN